jgi:hypothetical protein
MRVPHVAQASSVFSVTSVVKVLVFNLPILALSAILAIPNSSVFSVTSVVKRFCLSDFPMSRSFAFLRASASPRCAFGFQFPFFGNFGDFGNSSIVQISGKNFPDC